MIESKNETRRFNLGDAMILVAATAVGLAAVPLFDRVRLGMADIQLGRYGRLSVIHQLVAFLLWGLVRLGLFLSPMLAAWTLAVVLLRFRRPRPAPRRMVRQAGMVACGAAILGMALAVVELAIVSQFEWFTPGPQLQRLLAGWLRVTAPQVGMAVAAARMVHAALLGRRPAVDAIDRLARRLGWLWIALVPILGWTIILEFI